MRLVDVVTGQRKSTALEHHENGTLFSDVVFDRKTSQRTTAYV